jgi:hypothetical protein
VSSEARDTTWRLGSSVVVGVTSQVSRGSMKTSSQRGSTLKNRFISPTVEHRAGHATPVRNTADIVCSSSSFVSLLRHRGARFKTFTSQI